MKCPKLKFFRQFPGAEEQPIFGDCIKEECAWWDELGGRCAVLGIMLTLGWINQGIADLIEKMPHSGQFVK